MIAVLGVSMIPASFLYAVTAAFVNLLAFSESSRRIQKVL